MNPTIRLAAEADVSVLHALIQASIRSLQASDYTRAQIEAGLDVGSPILRAMMLREGWGTHSLNRSG
jgi:hypothetical protein